MNVLVHSRTKTLLASACLDIMWAPNAFADQHTVYNAEASALAVNGGADTANPGVSCLQTSSPPEAACAAGWIAIRNNNAALLAAAMQAKASNQLVHIYYDVGSSDLHCPGQAMTPCSLISIISP